MIDETMQMPAEQGITPDSWVIVEVNHEGERFQKILSGWSGSYLYGDSWRISSQIKEMNIDIDSDKISGLTEEVKNKLRLVKPETFGQALRIDGMTPAAINLLLAHTKRYKFKHSA